MYRLLLWYEYEYQHGIKNRTRCYSFDQSLRECNGSLSINMINKNCTIFPDRVVSTVYVSASGTIIAAASANSRRLSQQNLYKTCVSLVELGRTSRHFIVHFKKIPTKSSSGMGGPSLDPHNKLVQHVIAPGDRPTDRLSDQ